jgi:hypothetical protein
MNEVNARGYSMKSFSYKVRRAWYNYWNLYAKRSTPIAIFCTGRVGSMAMFYTLENYGLFTFKIEHLARAERRSHFGNSDWFYKHVVQTGRSAKIISIARDPLALMISDFFNKLHWISGKDNFWEIYSIEELEQLFNQKYFEQGRHYDSLNWWDKEFKVALGINIYEHPSPRDAGWVRFEQAPYDVLLLRTELDDAKKSAVLGDFVNYPDLQLQRLNVGDEKIFGPVYQQFKAEVKVSQKNLDYVYQSAYAQHFFTEQEITSIRNKWSKEV